MEEFKKKLNELISRFRPQKNTEDSEGDTTEVNEVKTEMAQDTKTPSNSAQKKRSLIIRGIVLAALVIVGGPEILKMINPPAQKAPKSSSKNKLPPQQKKTAPPGKETPSDNAPTPAEIAPAEVAPADTKKSSAKMTTPDQSTKDPPAKAVAKKVIGIPPGEPSPVPAVDLPAQKPIEVSPPINKLGVKSSPPPKKSLPLEEMAKLIGNVSSEVKKNAGPMYVTPPEYRRQGRGLVYNCKGSHWACVDKFAYLQCHANQTWAQKNNRPFECVIQNVYASVEDCGVIQEHKINTETKITFCKPKRRP